MDVDLEGVRTPCLAKVFVVKYIYLNEVVVFFQINSETSDIKHACYALLDR